MDMTEQQAIDLIRQRDPTGLDALVRLHQVGAVRLAFNILRNRADADDAVADAFLDAYDHISHLHDEDHFGPWFIRIVANRSLGMLRRQKRRSRIFEMLWRKGQAEPQKDPELIALTRETDRILWSAVNDLPPQERLALVLRYYLGYDENAIALTMSCPVGTVKTRLRRARLRLQAKLLPRLGTATVGNI